MGYCPRCGENPAWGEESGSRPGTESPAPLKFPENSTITHLPTTEDGGVIMYGGARFRVHREPGVLVLHLLD